MVTALEVKKSFSLADLGHGSKHAGGHKCQITRFQVMERIRAAAELSLEQANGWEFFRAACDREVAGAQQEKWVGALC